jgi:hypothetical protein
VVGSCKYSDEPVDSGTTELVRYAFDKQNHILHTFISNH